MLLFLFFYCVVIILKLISFRTLRSLCIDLVIFLIPLTLLVIALPYVFRLFLPFIVGFSLYLAANPLNKRLQKKNIPGSLSAFISLSLISLILFLILRTVFSKIISELSTLTQNADMLYASSLPDFSVIIKKAAVPKEIQTGIFKIFSSFWDAFETQLTDILLKLSTALVNAVKNIPSMFVSVFATIFTTFFLLKEDKKVFGFFQKFFGEKTCEYFSRIKNSFFNVTLSYFKAQLIIESIIFIILLIGFFLLKVNYAFLLAIITAIVDAVPIFGTGTVLIPMSLFNFLSGNNTLGWGLLILYGAALLARQLCEPKIIGSKLGMHPLATIFSLYVGMKLFGIIGLILGPICAIFIKTLIFPQ